MNVIHSFIIAAALMLLPAMSFSAEEAIKKQIFILNSFHKGYEWTDRQVEGIEEVFSATGNAQLRIEYMDTRLVDTAGHNEVLKSLFKAKYAGIGLDVIIAIDSPALHFLGLYRETLFPGVPVVFSGVNHDNEEAFKTLKNIVGISSKTDIARNLDLVLDLHSAVKRIYVIADSTPDGEILFEEFLRASIAYQDRLDFEYLVNLQVDELKAVLADLPSDSAVLYLGLFRDSTGQEFSPGEIIPRLSESSPVPVFGTIDYQLGYGIVGGHLKSAFSIGQAAGLLAQQILAGKTVEDLPGASDAAHTYMFDFRQLARFNLPYHRLPDSSVVIEEPDTFYYRYRKLIWPVLAVFAAMLIYIAVLLFNIRKRKKAERGLQNILDQAGQLLQLDSLEQFGRDIQTRLANIVPLQDPPLLFKYAGQAGQGRFDRERLFPVLPPQTQADLALIPQQNPLRQAIESARNQYTKDGAAIYFDNPDMPLNLALLATKSRLDTIDRHLLDIFTNNVSVSVDNLEKYKLIESLTTARKIQESMLPTGFTEISEQYGIDLYAQLLPAKTVSGDLYDFFAVDENRLCVLLGDVSDKGMPAALFMATTKTLIRAIAENCNDAGEFLAKANDSLCRGNDMSMFVTLFLAIFDRRNGDMVCVNGGHNAPYLLRQGAVEPLVMEQGVALGVIEGMSFIPSTITVQPGDALFIYSDGISEAMNAVDEAFGEARLQEVLSDAGEQPAEAIVRQVLARTASFVQGAAQSDDMTLLYLRRLAG